MTFISHTDLADDAEPVHHASQTARVLDEVRMQGWRPHEDEPDPRPLPDGDDLGRALSDVFDVLGGVLADTRLEPDLPDLLWSVVNVFHRKSDRVQRDLDDNEDRQRRAQQEQDGSEVKSVELERLIAEGISLLERRDAFERLRDQAADLFEARTGSACWRRSKSAHRRWSIGAGGGIWVLTGPVPGRFGHVTRAIGPPGSWQQSDVAGCVHAPPALGWARGRRRRGKRGARTGDGSARRRPVVAATGRFRT